MFLFSRLLLYFVAPVLEISLGRLRGAAMHRSIRGSLRICL